MSVNNLNQEQYKTREEYKRAKAEEQQRKRDAEKRAKDEARQLKDAEKRAKDEARQLKYAEKRAKDEARTTQNPNKLAKTEVLRQKRENSETPRVNETTARDGQRTANHADKEVEATPVPYKRVRIRLIPIWLRIVLLAALVVINVMAGAVVGYGMLGGGKIAEVFHESTWTHIIDLVEKGK